MSIRAHKAAGGRKPSAAADNLRRAVRRGARRRQATRWLRSLWARLRGRHWRGERPAALIGADAEHGGPDAAEARLVVPGVPRDALPAAPRVPHDDTDRCSGRRRWVSTRRAKPIRPVIVVALALVGGCTTSERILRPGGQVEYLIACGAGTGWNICYAHANEVCPTGYTTLSEAARTATRSAGDRRGSLQRWFPDHHQPASGRPLVRTRGKSHSGRRHSRSHRPQRLSRRAERRKPAQTESFRLTPISHL